jgi:hypothetical protein
MLPTGVPILWKAGIPSVSPSKTAPFLTNPNRSYVLQSGSVVLKDTAENLEKNEMVREAYLGE